jgi:hypothetical protein
MADLIQEFFLRDFSEAEHESLSRLLEGSPDAVLRYEKLLEQNYLATGLPLPSLPNGLQNLPHTGGGGFAGGSGLSKFLVIALATAGVVAWKFWPRPPVEARIPTPKTKGVSRPSLPPKVQPQPASPSAEGQELSVVVDSHQTALVTVRILDGTGREVRALYTGFVQPGHWSFRWDGILSDGQPAPAGDYRIDVQSGTLHQTKDIKIRLK